MNDKFCFEALEKSLKDLFYDDSKPFEGMPIVLGGDFSQILPVKPEGSKDDIINTTISNSYPWSKSSKVYHLRENMRLTRSFDDEIEKLEVSNFSKWILDIGNETSSSIQDENDEDTTWIKIPNKYIIE